MIVVFHDNSTITRVKYALCLTHFRLFFTVNMLELGPIGFHSIFISCCFEHVSFFFCTFLDPHGYPGQKRSIHFRVCAKFCPSAKHRSFFFKL